MHMHSNVHKVFLGEVLFYGFRADLKTYLKTYLTVCALMPLRH